MMTEPGNPTGITGAIRKVNSIIQERKALGIDILTKDVGEHLNPGDLYDAYEAIGRQPRATFLATEDMHSNLRDAMVALHAKRVHQSESSRFRLAAP